MGPSPAYLRFKQSMVIGFDQWHDGTGFDLSAIPEMTADERADVRALLSRRETTWREIEAIEALDEYALGQPTGQPTGQEPNGSAESVEPPQSVATDRVLQQAVAGSVERDTRLAAAEALYRQGRKPDFDLFLAKEICDLDRLGDGCTRALLLAEQYPSDVVKQALLYASNNRTECAMHCAALLCYLCGVAKEPFDWSMRPFFLNFGLHASSNERQPALEELRRLTGMTLKDRGDFLS